jgi:hypothetical protein
MSTTSPGDPTEEAIYRRGAGVGDVNGGRVIRVLLAACLIGLVIVTVVLTISAARQDSRSDRLKNEGVPVVATVTGCEGVGASINVGVEYYVCRANYSYNANAYNEVLGGNRADIDPGTKVQAVAVPGSPALLATVQSVDKPLSTWEPYVTPIALACVTLGSVGGYLWWSARRKRRVARDPVPDAPAVRL